MYHRGTVCAHCADAEAEEPCAQCLQTVCISCLLDRIPCRDEAHRVAATRSASTQALETLAACGVAVAGERLVAADVPLWQIESVKVEPVGDPVVGQPDVFTLTVRMFAGYVVELLRRSEAAVDDLYEAAQAVAYLAGADVETGGG